MVHSVVNAFIYMTVGALDFKTGSSKNDTAQRPGPWDRDSIIVADNIFCAMCVIVKYYVAYTLQIYVLRNLKSCCREMKEKQRGDT